MTLERFHTLVEAYGADHRRWPQAEREEALDFQRRRPFEATVLLEVAERLDAALALSPQPAADARLALRIADTAPRRRLRLRLGVREWAGFAGIGLAGAFAGAMVVAMVLPLGCAVDEANAYAPTAFDTSPDVPSSIADE